MLACIIMVGLAFIWLGYETDWMRIRLPVGERIYKFMDIPNLERKFNIHLTTEPICGWGWLLNKGQYVEVDYNIELRCNGTSHKFTAQKKGIVKEVMKINTKPHKPLRDVYPVSHYTYGITVH